MIVDICCLANGLEVSYINEHGAIDIAQYHVCDQPYQYPIWQLSDEVVEAYKDYKDYKGRPVKRGYAKRFDTFSTIEFLLNLPEEEQKKLFAYNKPAIYFYDIETEIEGEFPKPDKAKTPINAISTCDEQCNAIIQTTLDLLTDVDLIKQCAGKKPTIDDAYAFINNIIQNYMSQKCFEQFLKKPPVIKIIEHDSEYDMLNMWTGSIFRNISALSGWNIHGFDNPYVKNRCKMHGIDMAQASIVGRTQYKSGMPEHKFIEDYMNLIDRYDYSIHIKENLKLDYIANRLFNCGKLPYKGGLKELYEQRPCTFVAYNCVDVMINAMIHAKCDCMQNVLGLSMFTNIDMNHCQGPVKQSEGVLMTQMLKEYGGKVVVAQGDAEPVIHDFEGGFVKQPVEHYGKYVACNDYSGLYPSIMMSHNLSPFNYIRRLKTKEEIERYRNDPNYTVTVTGGLYHNDKEYEYKKAQVMLGKTRNDHKHTQFFYVNNHVALIEAELTKRGLL